MKNLLISLLNLADESISKLYLRLFNEKKSLISFLFHGNFRNKNEIGTDIVYPQGEMSIEQFQQFVEYFLERGFSFVSPDDILNGLDNSQNHILITFDDGYFNNRLVLPVLRQYKVPAIFFISAKHVKENKSFWWDVIYRERRKRNVPIEKINYELEGYKKRTAEEVEKYIVDNCGRSALTPLCDIDRPFTPSELKDFSKEPLVVLGNHTNNHAILTNYSASEIKTELETSQKSIYDMTEITPEIIAYPNGNVSKKIIAIVKESGFKLGFTAFPKKNRLNINLQGDDRFLVNRFMLLGGNITKQLELSRSDLQLKGKLLELLNKVRFYDH